jgi:hypothetical protein
MRVERIDDRGASDGARAIYRFLEDYAMSFVYAVKVAERDYRTFESSIYFVESDESLHLLPAGDRLITIVL